MPTTSACPTGAACSSCWSAPPRAASMCARCSGGPIRRAPPTAAPTRSCSPARPRLKLRWDRASGPYCQHQKSWVVDDTGFVGGINLTAKALERHDAYLEVNGPSASDVAHNFVQRWNGTSEPHGQTICRCRRRSWRLVARAPCRSSGCSATSARSSRIRMAIDAAERSIYIENQAIPIPPIAARLESALKRGVEVIFCSCPPIPRSTSMRRARTRRGGSVRRPGGAWPSSDVPPRRPVGLRPLQADDRRRRLGDDRLVQPAQPFVGRECRDECLDSGMYRLRRSARPLTPSMRPTCSPCCPSVMPAGRA